MSKFEFGWNNPRGVHMLGKIQLNGGNPTGLTETPTDVLRDLWMVQFGSRAVTHDVMWNAGDRGEANVAQELSNRSLVEQRKVSRMDMEKPMYYYVLTEKEYANR